MIPKKEYLLSLVHDSVVDSFYYNCKNNNQITTGEVDEMIKTGVITKEEVLLVFSKALDEHWSEYGF